MDYSPDSLSEPQAEFLRCVATFPVPPAVGDVARSLGVDAPAASIMVRRLVDRGLLRRCYDEQNRRLTLLELTENGRAICHLRPGLEFPLTSDRLRLLAALARLDTQVTITNAARAAGINRSRASLASATLLERGLIRRTIDKVDLRRRLLELTREGRAVCDKLSGALTLGPGGK